MSGDYILEQRIEYANWVGGPQVDNIDWHEIGRGGSFEAAMHQLIVRFPRYHGIEFKRSKETGLLQTHVTHEFRGHNRYEYYRIVEPIPEILPTGSLIDWLMTGEDEKYIEDLAKKAYTLFVNTMLSELGSEYPPVITLATWDETMAEYKAGWKAAVLFLRDAFREYEWDED